MQGFVEPCLLVLVASAMCPRDVAGGIVSCNPNPCKNSVLCRTIMLPGVMKYECVCLPGFSGETCGIEPGRSTKPPTSTAVYMDTAYCSLHTPCQNGGSCIDGVTENDYQCKCPMGFEGKDCQIPTQPEGTKEIVLTDDSCERKVSVGIPQVKYMATLGCEEGTILVKSVAYGSGTHWHAWIEQIAKICNAQTQCKVAAKDDMLDDQIMRVYKRLIIVYECLTKM